MQRLKLIGQQIVHFFELISRFPQSVAMAVKQRQQQADLDGQEAERIDRICNPSKYLGK